MLAALALAVAVTGAACASAAAPAGASTICGEGIYSYAGFTGGTATRGVSATIEQDGPLAVHAGHVAAWIGVVDPDTGGAWLQVGLSALPGQTSSAIYVEQATPGSAPFYWQLATGIPVGEPHTFALVEQPYAPDTWVVLVDGRVVARPLHLAGSSRWTAQVVGESWAGDRTGACNAYSYRFADVRLVTAGGRATGLAGRATADPNYAVADRTSSSFVAVYAPRTPRLRRSADP